MRRLFAILAACPVLLVLLLWLSSYLPGDWHLRSADGRLFAFSVRQAGQHYLSSFPTVEVWKRLEQGPLRSQLTTVNVLGVRMIAHGEAAGSATEPFVALSVPWAYLLIPALLPLWWYWRYRRQHGRSAQNRCVRCGYDLRASPGQCPECGAAGASS